MTNPLPSPQPRAPFLRRRGLQILAALAVSALWIWRIWPGAPTTAYQSVVRLTAQMEYQMAIAPGDTLRLTIPDGRAADNDGMAPCPATTTATAVCISPSGHMVTSDVVADGAPDSIAGAALTTLLQSELQRLTALHDNYCRQQEQLALYTRRHTEVDDGYDDVVTYAESLRRRLAATDSILHLLNRACHTPGPVARLRILAATAEHDATSPTDDEGNLRLRRYRLRCHSVARQGRLWLWQTDDGRLPRGIDWRCTAWGRRGTQRKYVLGYRGSMLLPEAMAYTDMDSTAGIDDGMPLIDGRGRLCGIRTADGIAATGEIDRLYRSTGHAGQRLWRTMTALIRRTWQSKDLADSTVVTTTTARSLPTGRFITAAEGGYLRTDSLCYTGQTLLGKPDGYGQVRYADGSTYRGFFVKGQRHGQGTWTTADGMRISGVWQADTLPEGTLQTDSTRYEGRLSACRRPQGQGRMTAADGATYWGEWTAGMRHGFGIAIGDYTMVRAGTWRRNEFVGERMVYTADRVYGIDIAKYQHIVGGKTHAIDWQRLRITSLDRAGDRRTLGHQDYPVSFIYIKASEGTTITNRFYAADIAAARRRGFPVGAYHFFRTTQSGRQQALHFLRTARPQRGDMAPVLDVEPTDAAICRMGGKEALHREMAAWVRTVKEACGTLPVIYVSQSFVHKYFDGLPHEVAACPTWIARYSNYMPVIHMTHWQLSPRGRVAGIKGDVDINVFNGSKDDFHAFLSQTQVTSTYTPPKQSKPRARTGKTRRRR